MKKLTIMFAFVAMVMGFWGCKKNVNENASNNSQMIEKFYRTTDKTKPAVLSVIEHIKETGKLGDIAKFVKKYGYPNWEKVILKDKNETLANTFMSRDMNESFILIPTILTDQVIVNGFIAVDIMNDDIFIKSFVKSEYDNLPFKSSNTIGMSAEDLVMCMMRLEKEVNGIDKFKITDPLLEYYKQPILPTDVFSVGLYTAGRDICTFPNPPDDGCVYWSWFQQQSSGDWIQVSPWQVVAGSCAGLIHIVDIRHSTLIGEDNNTAGGYSDEFAECSKNFNELISSGSDCSDFQGSQIMNTSNYERTLKYKWICYRTPTYSLVSEEFGEHEFTSTVYNTSGEWTWKSLSHTKINHQGFMAIISISYKDNSSTPTLGLYNAAMSLDFSVTKSLVCKSFPFESTTNYSPSIVLNVND